MSADVAALLARLELETVPLAALLATLDDAAMRAPTPARGWTVHDQVCHLAYFDEAAAASLRADGGFDAYLEEAARLGEGYVDDVARRLGDVSEHEALAWWAAARRGLVSSVEGADPSARVAWYGPAMSVASMVTARTMETWAHGQDVYDALGVPHPVTDALQDVAHLCARTRANSYAARGLAPPDGDVAVVLQAPDGSTWTYGDGTAGTIRGDAVEFCLVATQRRHPDDTSLRADTPLAREWLQLAQAFAGPPGEGRTPHAAASR